MFLPGIPLTIELSGISVPSITTDPAATRQLFPIVTLSFKTAPLPISVLLPIFFE